MRNKFAGPCRVCGGVVPAGQGRTAGKRNGHWTVVHASCVPVVRPVRDDEGPVYMTDGQVSRWVQPDDVHDARKDGFREVSR